MSVPVPGDNHPVVALFAPVLAGERPSVFQAPIPPVLTAASALDPDPYGPEIAVLTFTAERAAQSLYPEYGSYVWRIWKDQYGRHVTEPRAEWVENPLAFTHGEWNPPKRRTKPTRLYHPW